MGTFRLHRFTRLHPLQASKALFELHRVVGKIFVITLLWRYYYRFVPFFAKKRYLPRLLVNTSDLKQYFHSFNLN